LPPLMKLLREDRRYKLEAYQFVRIGLTFAQDVLELGQCPEGPGSVHPDKVRPEDQVRPDKERPGKERLDKGHSDKKRPGKEKPAEGEAVRVPRHVTGRDLCLALKQLAHEQYGRLAKLVLASWGLRSTSDFGEIVYNLIRIGEMSKSDADRRADFDDVYDFDALVEEFAITKDE
jgi:uncharacterized repeat protein (TIGR04138 family)